VASGRAQPPANNRAARHKRTAVAQPQVWGRYAGRSGSASYPSGEQHCRGGNRNEKVAHHVLYSASPANLNTESVRVFRDRSKSGIGDRYPQK